MASTITKPSDIPQSVPMFLRKTYHMIDSCDPAVACWSEDGETFVVKDPSKFESEIIPQFFKHSKFTSFVRQLNFYSFRKIKYVDTIRLDPKLEAETANFWRFRHEKFQRGKPHLLTEIKRMNGHKNTGSASGGKKGSAGAAATSASGENSTEMKQELDTLKKRIEEMNKNMTELTSMVQKVTLKPTAGEAAVAVKQEPNSDVPVGAKRKKVDVAAVPDSVGSSGATTSTSSFAAAMPQPLVVASAAASDVAPAGAAGSLIQPDEMLSSALEFEEVLPMLTDDPTEHLQALTSHNTSGSALDSATGAEVLNAFSADDALVDLCHHSFDDTSMELDTTATGLLPDPSTGQAPASVPFVSPAPATSVEPRKDRADPVLMDRLSEALAVLPKEMQEQIVERLIAAITTTDLFAPLQTEKGEKKDMLSLSASTETQQPQRQQETTSTSSTTATTTNAAVTPEVGMPLAAATLAALLSHYSAQVKKSKDDSKDNASRSGVKSIPVIPVHA